MDASDWTRIKRLNGARNNVTTSNWIDQDYKAVRASRLKATFPYQLIQTPNPGTVNPAPIQLEVKNGRKVYTEFGTSKTRSPASFFTDYKASLAADYVTESGGPGNKSLVATRICDCSTQDPVKHNGLCIKCTHDNIRNSQTTNSDSIVIVLPSEIGESISFFVQKNKKYTIVNNTDQDLCFSVYIGDEYVGPGEVSSNVSATIYPSNELIEHTVTLVVASCGFGFKVSPIPPKKLQIFGTAHP